MLYKERSSRFIMLLLHILMKLNASTNFVDIIADFQAPRWSPIFNFYSCRASFMFLSFFQVCFKASICIQVPRNCFFVYFILTPTKMKNWRPISQVYYYISKSVISKHLLRWSIIEMLRSHRTLTHTHTVTDRC